MTKFARPLSAESLRGVSREAQPNLTFAPPCTQLESAAPHRSDAAFESAARNSTARTTSGGSSSANAMVKVASRPGATLQQAPGGLKMGEDMPFVCEAARAELHIRMIKMPMSRECKISGRPYTAFAGSAEARYKETIIAPEVAIAKNVCQVCLMDMEYNLPVRVRDQLMGAGGERGGIQTPSSDTNKEYHWANQRKAMEEGTLQGFQELNAEGRQGMGQSFNKLASLSRGGSAAHSPYYDRNLPKMCSFWVRQTCTRVVNGACPFRPCNGQFRFPELASRHPDQLSALVRRLHADGAVSVMRDMSPEMEELRELIKDLQQGSRDQAIRNRYHGTEGDKLAEKYLERASKFAELRRPRRGLLAVGRRDHAASRSRTSTTRSTRTARWPRSSSSPSAAAPSSRTPCARRPRRRRALYRKLSVKGCNLKLWWAKATPPTTATAPARAAAGAAAAAARRAGRRRRRASRRRRARRARAHYPSMNPSAMGARPDQ